jgi:GntP family gluconate:H+ symporter
MSPFLVLAIGVIFVIVAIGVLKLHPFVALVFAAILVGILSPDPLPLGKNDKHRLEAIDEFSKDDAALPLKDPNAEQIEELQATKWSLLVQIRRAFEQTAVGLGKTAGSIAIVIALAAIIGQCLMVSGAADKIVRRLLGFLGEKRANYALLGSGYVLSVPVFFDTVFFLLVPLARAMRLRTGRNYMMYVMAICAGGAVTHGLVPPTPGPLFMAEELDIDLGIAILGGFLIGLPVAFIGGIVLPRILTKFYDIPMRDAPGSSTEELQEIVDRSDDQLPGFLASISPVAIPVLLITAFSIFNAIFTQMASATQERWLWLWDVMAALGDKHFAMIIATLLALWLMKTQKKYSLKQLTKAIEPALLAAGVIILITAAGGAFGAMLRDSGLKEAIKDYVSIEQGGDTYTLGIVLIFVAFGIASVLKIAQGSGTVAMMTGASIMAPILIALSEDGIALPYHPIYIFASIAFGSKVISWMNDSGFWVVSRMSGFNQAEALKTWTLQLGIMGVIGLAEVLILVHILPFKG